MLVRVVLGSVVALLATACSSKPAPAAGAAPSTAAAALPSFVPTYASGTRLRARVYVTADGQRQPVGFHDTARNEDCSFHYASDGVVRCLPDAALPIAAVNLFADSACTKRTTTVASGCPAPSEVYASRYTPSSCGSEEHWTLYTATKVDGAAPRYQLTGQCVAAPGPAVAPAGDVYVEGDAVAATSFVAAQAGTVDHGDGLLARTYEATDGARVEIGFALASYGDCAFQRMADGVARCIPSGATTLGPSAYFADASCAGERLVYASPGGSTCSTQPLFADVASETACAAASAVLTLGDAVAGDAPLYENNQIGGGCTLSSTGTHQNVYQLKDLTSTLPHADSVASGKTRLVPKLVPQPSVPDLVVGWRDTQLELDCTFRVASDGKIRCLPTAPTVHTFYADPACASADRVGAFSDAVCGGEIAYALEPTADCNATTTRVYAVGARRDVSASFEASTGQCVGVPVKNGFAITEVDPARFAEAQLVVE